MDNTKLAASLRSLNGQFELDTLGRREPLIDQAADALEAAEAELTRRDEVIAEVKLRLYQAYGYAPEDRIRGALLHIEAFEAGRSAAAPVSLEAVKAADDERVARLMAYVTPLGYSAALALVQAQAQMLAEEARLTRSTEGDNRG